MTFHLISIQGSQVVVQYYPCLYCYSNKISKKDTTLTDTCWRLLTCSVKSELHLLKSLSLKKTLDIIYKKLDYTQALKEPKNVSIDQRLQNMRGRGGSSTPMDKTAWKTHFYENRSDSGIRVTMLGIRT